MMSQAKIESDEVVLPRRLDQFLAGDLLVSTGDKIFLEEQRVAQPFERGLTVAVTLRGQIDCRIDDRTAVRMAAPSVSLILTGRQHRREQVFGARQHLRYTLVHLSPVLVESHLGRPFQSFVDKGRRHGDGQDPALIVRRADAMICSVALQLIVCPLEGVARSLFLMGKSFELIALALECCVPEIDGYAAGPHLSAGEVERLTIVRMTLLDQIAQPPSLEQLAASAGFNTRTLGSGFRRLFGTTVAEFIREQRLQLAYRLIATGETSVTEIAYSIGYTPPYLSTLFRARFGLPPSDLIERRLSNRSK
jgi:AraC family transcriptional activator of pyochelin receptor